MASLSRKYLTEEQESLLFVLDNLENVVDIWNTTKDLTVMANILDLFRYNKHDVLYNYVLNVLSTPLPNGNPLCSCTSYGFIPLVVKALREHPTDFEFRCIFNTVKDCLPTNDHMLSAVNCLVSMYGEYTARELFDALECMKDGIQKYNLATVNTNYHDDIRQIISEHELRSLLTNTIDLENGCIERLENEIDKKYQSSL